MSGRGPRVAALAMAIGLLAAGCSSSSHASSTTSTTSGKVSLTDATAIVSRSTDAIPSDQAGPLLQQWCAAARSGDDNALVSALQALPSASGSSLDEVLGALEKGAEAYCPSDTSSAPDLLSKVHDALVAAASTTTTASPSTTATTTGTARPASSARTATTVHHATATTAATTPPTTAAAVTSSTTSTTDLCNSVGGGSGVVVGGGGASSCSRSSSG